MFSASTKVKLDKPLFNRLTEIATIAGYSSTHEFVVHILEKEVSKFEEAGDKVEVEKQLRGLGYIE